MARVARLDRFEDRVGWLRGSREVDPLEGGSRRGERTLVRAVACRGEEDGAAGGRRGGDRGEGEVRARDETENGGRGRDEREADGVLLAAEKA